MKKNSLDILYEDNDIIVCVKPAGIATESSDIRHPDMVSMVKSHLLSSKAGSEPYLGLIHRLDQPVFGILVFAKNKAAAAELSRQVQTDEMGKFYKATVQGNLADVKNKTLTDYLIKDSKTNMAKVVAKGQKDSFNKPSKEAKLIITALSYNESDDTTLLKIKLLTGRFHQIRAQLSHYGYPIVGDVKYGAKPVPDDDYEGIKLYADELRFIHPTNGERMNFTI